MPSVSVIVPVYNASRFLPEAIDSLKAQTFDDFEVILVNDGSTDNSLEICRQACISDTRFRLIDRENGGLSAARNTGLDAATGDYVTFLDADDALMPQALEMWVGAAIAHNVSTVVSQFSNDTSFHPATFSPVEVKVDDASAYVSRGLYRRGAHLSAWAKLYDRKLFKRHRFTEGIWYEDLDLVYKLILENDKTATVDLPLYFYRSNPDSFLNRWSDGRLDVLTVTDNLVDFVSAHFPQLLNAAENRRFAAHFNILALMWRNNVDNAEAIKRCRSVIKSLRRNAITDKHSRMRVKIGALAAYCGTPIMKFLSNIIYH